MKHVHQIDLSAVNNLPDLLDQMADTGVLGGGALGKGYRLIKQVVQDSEYHVILSLAGPLIPSGLRTIIADLLAEGLIHSIITSGANIVHDIIEAIGHHHLQGSYGADDEHLIHDNIGRIGNIFMNMDSFTALEDTLYQIFPKLFSTKKRLSSSELLLGIGQQLSDPHSILVQAAKHHVPIYSPGILDSMLGLHLWIWKQTHAIQLDLLEDMDQLSNQINTAKKTAAIILGGGIPKHFTMGANTLREGLDAAVQIISGSAHDGSLSGAPLSEGLGWHKVKPNRQYVTIRADATMAFPILIMGIKQFLASKR